MHSSQISPRTTDGLVLDTRAIDLEPQTANAKFRYNSYFHDSVHCLQFKDI